jgi:hypothetical protein
MRRFNSRLSQVVIELLEVLPSKGLFGAALSSRSTERREVVDCGITTPVVSRTTVTVATRLVSAIPNPRSDIIVFNIKPLAVDAGAHAASSTLAVLFQTVRSWQG